MKTRKTPMRQCMGCQEVKEKRELIRVVRTPEGNVCIDRSGRLSGRGAYLCDDPACLEKARKTKSLSRVLETEISDTLYDALRQEMTKHE